MFARTVPTLLVAFLLILAGCSGSPGGPVATDTATPDAPASDGSSGSNGDDASGSNDGDGGSNDGDGDGGDADESLSLTDPEAALRSAGSFTATWRYSGTDATGVEGAVSYTYRADLDAERAYVSVTTDQDGETTTGFETFTADGVTYTQFGSDDEVFYQAQPQEDLDVLSASLARTAVYGSDTDGLEKVGTETYDGVRVDRYQLSAADSAMWAGLGTTGTEPGDLAEFEVDYVVLVDADGLARYESWTFTGTTNDGQAVNGAWEYTLSDVGSTTVDDPGWLDDAKAQTGN